MLNGIEYVTGIEYLLIGLAAVGAGLVNALAGGGTLITLTDVTMLRQQERALATRVSRISGQGSASAPMAWCSASQ